MNDRLRDEQETRNLAQAMAWIQHLAAHPEVPIDLDLVCHINRLILHDTDKHHWAGRVRAEVDWQQPADWSRRRAIIAPDEELGLAVINEHTGDMVVAFPPAAGQRQIGLALGGEAGARLACHQGMGTSPDTVLRLVRRKPCRQAPTPRCHGVDDWAYCRGRDCCTILVDLQEPSLSLDPAPDAASLPATQFEVTRESEQAPTPLTQAERLQQESQNRRQAHYDRIIALRERGFGIRAISRELGFDRATIRRYLSANQRPQTVTRKKRASLLDAFVPYLRQRLTDGCGNAIQLWREIDKQGYIGKN